MTYLYKNDSIETYSDKEILIISFKDKVFDLFESFAETQNLISILKQAEHDEDIKFVLFTSEPIVMGSENYKAFVKDSLKDNSSGKRTNFPDFSDKKSRHTEIRLLDQMIHCIVSYNKICVSCFEGNVTTPFFGLFLSCDIRYAATNTSFSFLHNKYGLHPSGALPFFLIQEIGYSKSVELLLSESISVNDAYNFGLVDKILPAREFLERSLDRIHKYSYIKYSTLLNTKRLSAFSRNNLSDYLQYESTLLNLE